MDRIFIVEELLRTVWIDIRTYARARRVFVGVGCDLEALKVIYYEHMTRYHASNGDYLEMCRCYLAVYETPTVAADPLRWKPLLQSAAWYALLAPNGPEQADLVRRLHGDKGMDELPGHKALLKTFITKEIIHWSAL